jgi:hypothetical protein
MGRGKLREIAASNGWKWTEFDGRTVAHAVRENKFVALSFTPQGQVERFGTNALGNKVRHFVDSPEMAEEILSKPAEGSAL